MNRFDVLILKIKKYYFNIFFKTITIILLNYPFAFKRDTWNTIQEE